MKSDRPKRLLIVEEALCSTGFGHWYEYIRTIVEGAKSDGVEVNLLVPKVAEPQVVESLNATPVLRYSAWDKTYDSPSALKRYAGVIRHNLRLAKDIRQFLAGAEHYDLVLAPTILAHHVLAWYWVLQSFGGRKFDRLAMIFVHTPGQRLAHGDFVFPPNTYFMRAVLKRMKSHQEKGRFTPVAETRRAAEHFKAFCGLDFALYPHVVSFPTPAESSSPAIGSETTLGSFGFARAEKGSELLLQAVVKLLGRADGARTRFVIQWGKDFSDGRGGVVTKTKELLNDARVEFIDHALNTEQYQAKLQQVDGLVLPYQTYSYYNRVSRVAIEAACLGLPFVYPRNSWLEDLADRFGAGVGFEDGNLQDLVRAIREFSAKITSLRMRAAGRSSEARRYHSAKRFKACLFNEPDALRTMSF